VICTLAIAALTFLAIFGAYITIEARDRRRERRRARRD